MHPLHDYIARQISDRLKDHRIVVMGDLRKNWRFSRKLVKARARPP